MTPEAAFRWCEESVRTHDTNRYLAAVFAPASVRKHLFALYAFQHEIAKTAETVTQPVLGQIRLQWWRETLEGIYAGAPRQHEVALALSEAVSAHDLPQPFLDAMIDAREKDLDAEPFADMADLVAYAESSSAQVMKLALRILGAGGAYDHAARAAGIAYGMAGVLLSVPYWARRNRILLPKDRLAAHGLTSETMLAGEGEALHRLISEIADGARAHYVKARSEKIVRRYLPGLLPAALVPLMLTGAEASRFRRQATMLGAIMRGTV